MGPAWTVLCIICGGSITHTIASFVSAFLLLMLKHIMVRRSSWLTHVISWTIASFNRDQDLDYYGSSSLGDDDDLSETLDRVSVLFEQAGQTVDQSDAKVCEFPHEIKIIAKVTYNHYRQLA